MTPSRAALDVVIGHVVDAVDAGPSLLAHQGGWDEILMVAGPILIFALLLRSANRRAARLDEESEVEDAESPAPPPPTNPRRGPI
jgi:hypothetical protein